MQRSPLHGRILIPMLMCLLGLTHLASAQSDIQILYSPLVVELAGQRGESVPFEITILNEAQFSTAHFRTYVTGLRESQDGIYRTWDDSEWEHGASSWVHIQDQEFSVRPGQAYTVRGRVEIPRRGPASGYATVMVELVPEPAPSDVAASTAYYQRFTTALEITVGNQHKRSAYISEMQIVPTDSTPQLASQYGPNNLIFLATLQNDGDIHVSGVGQLIIRDALGRRVRSVPLGSGRGVVIPGAAIDFGSVLSTLAPGTYQVEARINYGGHRPAVARTTFEITDELAGISSLVGGRTVRVDATPATIDLSLTRHGYRAATVTVSNFDEMDVLVTVFAEDLVHDLDGVPVQLEPGVEMPNTARQWAQIRPDQFVLRPGQRRNIVVGFQVPEGHEGGRYARIVVQAEPADTDSRAQFGDVMTDLDISVLLTIGSEHLRELQIVDVVWQQAPDTPQVAVATVIGNSGTIHTVASGRLTLLERVPPSEELFGDIIVQRDERWEILETVVADVPTTPILPGELRVVQGALVSPLKSGTQYRVVVEVFHGDQQLIHHLNLWVDEAGAVHDGEPPEEETSPVSGSEV